LGSLLSLEMRMRKGRKSINIQLASVFMGVMALILFVCYLANNLLLERYYTYNKVNVLKNAYESLNEADRNDSYDNEEFESRLRELSERYALDVLIIDVESQTVKYEANDQGPLKMMLWDHIFMDQDINIPERPNIGGKKLFEGDTYEIGIFEDMRTNRDYLDIWGSLDSGNLFIVRTAIEGIHNNVEVANRFLGYVGLVAVLISGLLIFYTSRRVTKPILELATISEKMADLDFETRYTPRGNNEITLLGNSMNRLSGSLETTISELKSANIELKKDNEKKTEIDEMRKEFLSNVSHELKTPIAIIQGYAEGLKDGIADDPESIQYYCEVMVDEAQKMNAMVQKLMTLNQIEFSNEPVSMDRFDIVELIASSIATTDILLKAKDIVINVPDKGPVFVWGDPFRVEVIINNYLTNAINHCLYDKHIDIKISDKGNKARIAVFNTGDKIPDESIDRIWEKFYKVDKARTREYGGSGIGLSIVAAECQAMGLEYGACNVDGGVEFWFELDRQ